MKSIMRTALTFSLLSFSVSSFASDNIVRHLNEGSDFPIAKGVTLKVGTDITYMSGTVPEPFDTKQEKGTIAYFGDMEQQTVSILKRIETRLDSVGLSMSDVVKMQAFLVPDAATGKSDFAGFMKGYTQFFGTDEQPNLPSRSAINVHSLANPGWLIEIEVVAAKSN
ncbi:TPA: RidA family protein [Vibrio parahaemolyticus]